MMKLIGKTILISIISSMLMMGDFLAFAQDTQGVVQKQSNGTYTKTNTASFSGVSDTDLLSTMTMVAIGLVASRLYTYKMTTDVMLAAAGGAAFIVGEIMANEGYKGVSDSVTKSLTMSNDASKQDSQTNAQVDDLKKLKKSYDDAKEVADKKYTFQKAAMAAFGIAAIAAIVLKSSEELAFTGCVTTLDAAVAKCPSTSGPVGLTKASLAKIVSFREAKIPSQVQSNNMKAEFITFRTDIGMISSIATTAASLSFGTMAAPCGAAAAEVASCNSIPITLENAQSYGIVASIANNNLFHNKKNYSYNSPLPLHYDLKNSEESHLNKNYFQKLIGMMVPSAKASMLNILFGATGATVGLLLSKQYSVMVDTYLFTPMKRALVWGVLGGLTYLASESTKSQIDKLAENSQKIDKLLNSLTDMQSAATVVAVDSQKVDLTSAIQASIKVPSIPLAKNGAKTSCVMSAGESQCTNVASMITSSPDYANLPPNLQALASQVGTLGNGTSGTSSISGSTLATATSLGGKVKAINNLLKKEQDKLNSLLGNDNKINFAKEQSDLLNTLNKTGADALKKAGTTPSAFLASIGSMPISGSGTEASKVADTKPASSSSYKSSVGGSSGVAGSSKSNNKGMSLNFGTDQGADAAANAAAGGAVDPNAKYDMGLIEINPDSKISIFELISTRYIKSGYPKLLEEDNTKK